MSAKAKVSFTFCLWMGIALAACSPTTPETTHPSLTDTNQASCPVTAPEWLSPPEDSAVDNPPTYSYYYTNTDGSILASAWWEESDEYRLRADPQGVKTGWFRPAGETLEITGHRLDGEAPPLESNIPCCYPTRFQASGLYFPTEGCWEIRARAGDSELTFIVWVDP
jgi:hypothetical protein